MTIYFTVIKINDVSKKWYSLKNCGDIFIQLPKSWIDHEVNNKISSIYMQCENIGICLYTLQGKGQFHEAMTIN
jgi:hypothetical protein